MTIALCVILLCSWVVHRTNNIALKYTNSTFLKNIPEPSDIFFDSSANSLYIVSDQGILFETDLTGKKIRKAQREGMDFEGVEVKDSFIYVSDEKPRKIYQYRKTDLSLKNIYSVSWGSAPNKGFESLTYNYTKHCFVLVAEQPVCIIEYNDNFKELKRFEFKQTVDASSARWFNGKFYLLAKSERCIYECDDQNYQVKHKYSINVVNPEGLAFSSSGKIYITSDDLQKMYFFNELPININK